LEYRGNGYALQRMAAVPERGFEMMAVSRFDCASSGLALKALLSKTRRVVWGCFGLCIAIHLALTQVSGLEAEQKAVKPLTTQFVKRQPRLTKPLELRKRPRPKRRTLERKMVSVQAKMQRAGRGAGFQPAHVLRGVARPSISVGRIARFAEVGVEPQATAGIIEGAREVGQKIDMSLELLDINVLDTGRHHALVVQAPNDKRSIKGFCRLGVVYSGAIYGRKNEYRRFFEQNIVPAFLRLVDAMNRYTDINADVFGRITLDDAELFKTPWVYFMSNYGFHLPRTELTGLGKYLVSGGFVFADTYWNHPQRVPGYEAAVANIVRALKTQAISEAGFEVLPNWHPVYHCYFDFDGPPIGADGMTSRKYGTDVADYLEGLQVHGRLVAILSKKCYYGPWSHFGTNRFGGDYKRYDPERCFQFGVNLIVFALTQEGSITRSLMDTLR